LQQLRYESFQLDLGKLQARTEAELTQLGRPFLRERFKVSRESPELVRTLQGHSDRVSGVALSADGRLAVSASGDQTLKMWDVATGRELRTLTGHSGVVNGVALSADGRLAVSASWDCTLKVWDISASLNAGVAMGLVISTLATSAPLPCCAITPDGKTIVAGDSLGVVHFLEWVGGGEIQVPGTAKFKKQSTTKTKKSRRARAGGRAG
jgi:WD40 repeat protein